MTKQTKETLHQAYLRLLNAPAPDVSKWDQQKAIRFKSAWFNLNKRLTRERLNIVEGFYS